MILSCGMIPPVCSVLRTNGRDISVLMIEIEIVEQAMPVLEDWGLTPIDFVARIPIVRGKFLCEDVALDGEHPVELVIPLSPNQEITIPMAFVWLPEASHPLSTSPWQFTTDRMEWFRNRQDWTLRDILSSLNSMPPFHLPFSSVQAPKRQKEPIPQQQEISLDDLRRSLGDGEDNDPIRFNSEGGWSFSSN